MGAGPGRADHIASHSTGGRPDVSARAGVLLGAHADGSSYQPNLLTRSTRDQALIAVVPAAKVAQWTGSNLDDAGVQAIIAADTRFDRSACAGQRSRRRVTNFRPDHVSSRAATLTSTWPCARP